MVTPRKLEPAQRGRKGPYKTPMFEIDVTVPPSHFDELHRELWEATVAFPTFEPTDENYQDLAVALDHHMVYCELADQIDAIRDKGRQPDRKMESARDAARRPFAHILKMLAR
jgi:hypothetical protein